MGFFTGCTDIPINKVQDDKFNIGKYINGLCTFITSCETPITISIQGDWGSGKTSMMSMIESKLSGRKVLPIWFNTWQFSQFQLGNSLAISMLKVLLQKLEGKQEIMDKITGLSKNALMSATELKPL